MNYKIVSLLCLLSLAAGQYTSITTLNCPAQFSISTYNTSSDTTMATLGAFVYSGFQSPSTQSTVQKIVVNGDYAALNKYISQLMVPYVIFAVLFFAFFLFTVMCCLFDRSCPPCDCLRRDVDSNPYSKAEIRVVMVVLLLCAGGTLILSIISFSFVPEMKNNLSMTSCSIYLIYDTAINGDGVWGGYYNLRNTIGNITNLLSAAVTQIQIYFPGDPWLITSMQAMQTANVNIYNNYKTSTITTPNPDTTLANANSNLPTPTINSLFISAGMGPNGTANTMATAINAGLQTTAKLANQAYAITQSATLIQNSLSTILSNSQSSQNTLIMYNRQLTVSLSEFTTFDRNYFQTNFGLALTIFQAVFALALTGSLLALLGVVATHVFDVLSCRKMVHLGWTIYGLAYVGVIIVTFGVLSIGSISYGFCTYYKSMLTTPSVYNLLGESYTQNLFTRVDTCLFGDGNSLSKFSIAQQMNTVTSLFTNIQTYTSYTNSASNSYINPAISVGVISGWINAVNNYRLGIYVDTNPAITSNDNPNYAISQLNLYTYQGGGVATGSKDVWVWDKTNCSDPSWSIYNATAAVGTSLSTGFVTCLSFNEKLATSSATIWSFSDFTMRYVQIRNAYPDAYKEIIKYGQTLIAFRDSRINLFQAIQTDLTALVTSNTNFNSQLSSFSSRVTQFYGAVSTLNNLITNSLNGLIVSSNCRTLGDKLRFTYNVYCVNFMAQIAKLTLCSLLMLIFMFGGILAGSRFGMMYAEVEKVKRVTKPDEQESEKNIIQIQEEGTHSTHSNDSDD